MLKPHIVRPATWTALKRCCLGSLAALGLLLAVPMSAGASIGLGEVRSEPDIACPDPVNMVQTGVASAFPYYVPPGGGVITHWQNFGAAPNVSGRLQLWMPGGSEDTPTWTLVGRSDFATFVHGEVSDVKTRIPVSGGEALGLRIANGTSGCAFSSPGSFVNTLGAGSTDPVLGEVRGFTSILDGITINVAAILEPDSDKDGFGDETQDQCPTDASTHGPCPDTTAPKAKITKKPKSKIKTTKKKVTVKVLFTSEQGAKFKCKLDKAAYKACTSPYSVKAKSKGGKGKKHTISIKATDRAGNVGKAAVVEFKVIRTG